MTFIKNNNDLESIDDKVFDYGTPLEDGIVALKGGSLSVLLNGSEETLLSGTSSDDSFIGEIISFIGNTIPTGYLVCDGSTYDTDEYPDLYTLLGTNILPDMREATLAGIGTSGRNLTYHDVYTLGQFKDDSLFEHTHTITDPGHTHTASSTSHRHTGTVTTINASQNFVSGGTITVNQTSRSTSTMTYSSKSLTPSLSSRATGITINTYGDSITRMKEYGTTFLIRGK